MRYLLRPLPLISQVARALRMRGAGDVLMAERDEGGATGTTDPEPPTGISTFTFGLSEQQLSRGGGRMPALPREPPTFQRSA